MVTKEEYEAEIKEIEKRHELNKRVDGLHIKEFYVRTGSEGQSYVIFHTHNSAMPIVSCKVDVGLPDVLVKEDAERQLDKREADKQRLLERMRQEKIQEEVNKKQQEVRDAAAKAQAKVRAEAEKKADGFLKKFLGGK